MFRFSGIEMECFNSPQEWSTKRAAAKGADWLSAKAADIVKFITTPAIVNGLEYSDKRAQEIMKEEGDKLKYEKIGKYLPFPHGVTQIVIDYSDINLKALIMQACFYRVFGYRIWKMEVARNQ